MSSDKYSDEVPPVVSTIEEQLSAFVDGELPQEEMELLLRRLERGEGYRQTFSRYINIGSVLRGDVTQSDRIRAGVMDAVTSIDEPTVEMQAPLKHRSVGLRVAGFAAVAGICGLAVIGIQPSITGVNGVGEVPTVAAEAVQVPVQLAAASAEPMVRGQYTRKQGRHQVVDSTRMTSYLASHGEHAQTISWRVAEPGFTMQQARLDY